MVGNIFGARLRSRRVTLTGILEIQDVWMKDGVAEVCIQYRTLLLTVLKFWLLLA
jgi:hypothetical protein